MIPLRVFIDINVVVSAALKREGLRTALLLALTGLGHWHVSDTTPRRFLLAGLSTSETFKKSECPRIVPYCVNL